MDLGQLLERLRSEVGVVAAEVIPDDLFSMIVEGERGVTGAMGSMPVINTGLQDCIDRNTRICIFEDDTTPSAGRRPWSSCAGTTSCSCPTTS